jgi:sugar/nucleoside kinase (ribokinase family)
MARLRLLIQFHCLFLLILSIGEANQYKVLGVGAPCIDILINVENDVIESLGAKGGSIPVDSLFVQDLLGRLHEKNMILATGGSCSNTIKGLANFGHACGFYGKRGGDEFGERYIENIINLGIVPLVSIVEDSPTQICLCLISPDGDRTMRCFPGAASDMKAQDVTLDMFKGVSLVHLEGYNLYMKDPGFVQTVMRMAKEQGAMISIDLSSFELVSLFKPLILELLKSYVDVVFANADEVKALTGLDPLEGCKVLKELCPIAVVMTGKNGCIVGSGSNIIMSGACKVDVVDTTGAGDLFVSGFLHGVLENLPLDTCAMYGNMTGAAVVGVYGAEIHSSKWNEIREFKPDLFGWGMIQSQSQLGSAQNLE